VGKGTYDNPFHWKGLGVLGGCSFAKKINMRLGQKRKDIISPGDGDPRHGQNGYSNYMCRCDICRQTATANHYDYMHRNPEQQKKNRDRGRKSRGLQDAELIRLEAEYQKGKHHGGRIRVE